VWPLLWPRSPSSSWLVGLELRRSWDSLLGYNFLTTRSTPHTSIMSGDRRRLKPTRSHIAIADVVGASSQLDDEFTTVGLVEWTVSRGHERVVLGCRLAESQGEHVARWRRLLVAAYRHAWGQRQHS
jgi:hypothetical protein